MICYLQGNVYVEVSYGLCHLDLDGFDVWKELAECIKDLDWKWKWKRVESDDKYKPLDSSIKTKILQHMINFREELEQLILHTLQNDLGSLEIYPDSEGWIRVLNYGKQSVVNTLFL